MSVATTTMPASRWRLRRTVAWYCVAGTAMWAALVVAGSLVDGFGNGDAMVIALLAGVPLFGLAGMRVVTLARLGWPGAWLLLSTTLLTVVATGLLFAFWQAGGDINGVWAAAGELYGADAFRSEPGSFASLLLGPALVVFILTLGRLGVRE